MAHIHCLPLEVVYFILFYFVKDFEETWKNSRNSAEQAPVPDHLLLELLNLRLLGKSWALRVLPYAYQNLHFSSALKMNSFVETWNNSATISTMARLSRLSFDQITCPDLDCEFGSDRVNIGLLASYRIDFEKDNFNYKSITLEDIEEIIKFCGQTLAGLKFSFKAGAGFTPNIIELIKEVKGLRVLIIEANPYGVRQNHLKSIRALLNVTAGLELLLLDIGSIGTLDLSEEALPRLKHLSAACDTNDLGAITELCETRGRNISCLEYLTHPDCDRAAKVILALQNSLEVLFIESIPNLVPAEISDWHFPKLKIIRSINSTIESPSLAWLQLGFALTNDNSVEANQALIDRKRLSRTIAKADWDHGIWDLTGVRGIRETDHALCARWYRDLNQE
ncbi:uncharacterized protein MELLADRAFT_104912 [Melampsora larici-populina 98AG31]|uniref:F-box domain-containing protein n=1 Tax=Melampsora larici-populina (strain 98AG31 / pathotype 3-4-7) TaxID=747676 RepID=F4RGH8_MELLP|nr:uncharacterized protein MELLADRAFT_104912 [Melampsora larici-populina 98AG31]EGG08509.1 hypothetical protein MELLADRAFT_104912 [Melampsora larici-populina 98AG31]